MRGANRGRRGPGQPGELLSLAVLGVMFLSVGCAAAPMVLERRVDTVAGKHNEQGEVNGGPNVSRLTGPYALCLGRSGDEILVGDASSFRSYSRKTRNSSTFFENDGKGHTVSGSVKISNPRGCARYGSGESAVVFFVEGQEDVKVINDRKVTSSVVRPKASLTSIAIYEKHLYVTDQIENCVWKCSITTSGMLARDCQKVGCIKDEHRLNGISVNSKGIFLTGRNSKNDGALWWMDKSGQKKVEIRGGYVDVFTAPSGKLYAVSETQLFHVTPNGLNFTIVPFAGDKTPLCHAVVDGYAITLCGNSRLLVLEEYEMYVTSKEKHTLRALTLPPVNVTGVRLLRPSPVGYPDTDIMKQVVANLTKDVNKALSTTDSHVDPESLRVDPKTWHTSFTVVVQQTRFDTEKTNATLMNWTYERAEATIGKYYNLTKEHVFLETIIVPFCGDSSLDRLRREIAAEVGRILKFPLIYAEMPVIMNFNDINKLSERMRSVEQKNTAVTDTNSTSVDDPSEGTSSSLNITPSKGPENITLVKLLMPAPFANDTTRKLLAAANLTSFAHNVTKKLRGRDTRIDITFPDPPFNFSAVGPDHEQDVRWFVYNKVMKQLDICEDFGHHGVGAVDAVLAAGAAAPTKGGNRTSTTPSAVNGSSAGVTGDLTSAQVSSVNNKNTTNVKKAPVANRSNTSAAAAQPKSGVNTNVSNRSQGVEAVVATGNNSGLGCHPAITNRTETQSLDPPYDRKHRYEVFVPRKFNFNVSWCVDIIDWRDLEGMLNNHTGDAVVRRFSWCGHGCMIAFAMLGALVAAALVVLAVVLTSKRRRLAAVVAPPRPKFVGTLVEDEDEQVPNPMLPPGGGGGGQLA